MPLLDYHHPPRQRPYRPTSSMVVAGFLGIPLAYSTIVGFVFPRSPRDVETAWQLLPFAVACLLWIAWGVIGRLRRW